MVHAPDLLGKKEGERLQVYTKRLFYKKPEKSDRKKEKNKKQLSSHETKQAGERLGVISDSKFKH